MRSLQCSRLQLKTLLKIWSVVAILSPSASLAQQTNTTKAEVLAALNVSQQLSRGTKDGGGGDEMALEFKKEASQALVDLKRDFPTTFASLDSYQLTAVLESARVIVVDEALNVEIRDLIQNSVAVNIPELQIILVNRRRWAQIPNENLRKSIALHELLSLKGIEGTGYYPISTKLWTNYPEVTRPKTKDIGLIPNAVYNCSTSSKNMIGIGVEYQVSLQQNNTQIIYSEYSEGNIAKIPIHMELGRTKQTNPAVVRQQGSSYYIQGHLVSVEDSSSLQDGDMILDTKNLQLNILFVNGYNLPIPCKLVWK